jgi:hypothetical protein
MDAIRDVGLTALEDQYLKKATLLIRMALARIFVIHPFGWMLISSYTIPWQLGGDRGKEPPCDFSFIHLLRDQQFWGRGEKVV